MKNLYIDFDGVISDTIEVTYKMLEDLKIDRTDVKAVRDFYRELDWKSLLEITPLINNSMDQIQEIITVQKYDVAILTHVNSQAEAIAKINFIRKYLKETTIIPVPREVSKTDVVNAKNSILIDDFTGNLDEWEEKGGIGIKFSKEVRSSKYINITNLKEILALDIDKC